MLIWSCSTWFSLSIRFSFSALIRFSRWFNCSVPSVIFIRLTSTCILISSRRTWFFLAIWFSLTCIFTWSRCYCIISTIFTWFSVVRRTLTLLVSTWFSLSTLTRLSIIFRSRCYCSTSTSLVVLIWCCTRLRRSCTCLSTALTLLFCITRCLVRSSTRFSTSVLSWCASTILFWCSCIRFSLSIRFSFSALIRSSRWFNCSVSSVILVRCASLLTSTSILIGFRCIWFFLIFLTIWFSLTCIFTWSRCYCSTSTIFTWFSVFRCTSSCCTLALLIITRFSFSTLSRRTSLLTSTCVLVITRFSFSTLGRSSSCTLTSLSIIFRGRRYCSTSASLIVLICLLTLCAWRRFSFSICIWSRSIRF